MKVRQTEKELFNYFKKYKIVTPGQLFSDYGPGDYGLHSMLIPKTLVCGAIKQEYGEALDKLRNDGAIFEISVGIEYLDVMDGGRLSDLPLAEFTPLHNRYGYYKYGYSGYRWLPVVFCNDVGLKSIVQFMYLDERKNDLPTYTKNITNLNRHLLGSTETRLQLMVLISAIIHNRYDKWLSNLKYIEQAMKTSNKRLKSGGRNACFRTMSRL